MGAALLLDLKTWNILGGFSDKYFLYSEDTDLCWRARNAGFPVIYDPSVHIWHSQGDPSASARETGIVRLFDGLKLFTDLNYTGIRKSGLYFSVITDMLLRLAIMIPLQLIRKSDPLLQSRLRGYRKVLSRWVGAA
jgi:GT2 family glycosyltransferase